MIVLDTNVLSEIIRPAPSPAVLRWIAAQPRRSLRVTAISQAELLAGLAMLPEGKRRRGLADAAEALFASEFAARVLLFGPEAARAYAEIVARRRRSGRPLAPLDGMIAAIARVHGATVATRDRDLTGCGVPVANPWTEPETV